MTDAGLTDDQTGLFVGPPRPPLAERVLSAAMLVFSFVMLRTVIDSATKSLLRH